MMEIGESYNGVSDVDGIFSSEFRNYIGDENLICRYTIDDDGDPDWRIFKKEQQSGGSLYSALLDLLNKVTALKMYFLKYCLVQFWKAEEVTGVDDFGKKRFILSTRNQPFLIWGRNSKGKDREKICSLRMKMVDIVTGGAGEGVIGRVFRNSRMEFTPEIEYYSTEEYPVRNFALSCGINNLFAIPLSDSLGNLVGVLETVSRSFGYKSLRSHFIYELIYESPKSNNLSYLGDCKHLCGQCGNASFQYAISEVKDIMKMVGRSCNPVCAQTWMLCNDCESLSITRRIADEADASYGRSTHPTFFLHSEYASTLKKGEGIVGKAAESSHNLVYCEDIRRYSIAEYPLTHFARFYQLTSSFAICLKSDLTGSQIYILEFILQWDGFQTRDLSRILVPILESMRESSRTFKVASGEEIGTSQPVLIINARSPEKIVTLRKREVDLSLAIGITNIGARIPYILPHSIAESSTWETDYDDPMTGEESSSHDTFMEETPAVSASTVESELRVTIKANYGSNYCMFQLSFSSGIDELNQQVSRGLNLENGTYTVRYLDDDNDSILILCDDDLRQYISSSMQGGKYKLVLIIEPA